MISKTGSVISYRQMLLNDPLDAINAKLQRADETIQNLGLQIDDFLSADPPPCVIRSGFFDDPKKYIFMARGAVPIPLRFSVLAGEIVHHFRSCLDHLVVQLAAAEGQHPLNNHQFPICRKREKFKKSVAGGQLKGISKAAFRRIVAVQPYRHPTPDDTTINAIHKLDVRDKHSLLVVVAQTTKVGKEVRLGSTTVEVAITHLGDPTARVMTHEEVEVFSITLEEPAPDFRADTDFVTQVALTDAGSQQFMPVIPLLTKMSAFTRKTVNSFSDLLQ